MNYLHLAGKLQGTIFTTRPLRTGTLCIQGPGLRITSAYADRDVILRFYNTTSSSELGMGHIYKYHVGIPKWSSN